MYIRLRYRLCHLLQNCHILLHIPRRTCHPVALEPYDQSIGAELTQARELEGRGRSDKKYILIFFSLPKKYWSQNHLTHSIMLILRNAHSNQQIIKGAISVLCSLKFLKISQSF